MVEVITKKRCTKCGIEKSYDEFHKHKASADGLRSDCKVCRSAWDKAYREANKDKKNAQVKAWREANKEKIRVYMSKRRKGDPIFKLKDNMRTRVWNLLKGQKSKRTEEIIGCSYSQLYFYLNYNNLEKPSHDHIIPLSWADTEKELYALFRWENLQGMELEENISKKDRYCDKKRADQVARIHPDTDLIKQILSRQTKTKTQYIKE